MARYFRLPFADSGDKDPLPDETANSLVSYATGYSQDYQRNPASDPLARRMERNFFNQLLFDVTDTLKNLYETGTVPFITSAMNNGSPFSYPLGARVILSNRIYENTTANNTTTPPAAGWVLVDVVGMDARYLLESNNLSDLTNDDTARNNLSVYSRAETFTRTEQDARYLLESNNLSDLTSAAAARTNIGVSSTTEGDARYLLESNNLSDLTNAATARTNLQLNANYVQGAESLNGRITTNIDSFDLSGEYLVQSGSVGGRPTGAPDTIAFLRVQRQSGVGSLIQTYTSIQNVTWMRHGRNSVWEDWRQITLAGDFGIGANRTGRVVSNLDSVNNIGDYWVTSVTTGTRPTGASGLFGFLSVWRASETDAFTQIWSTSLSPPTTPQIFVRTGFNGAWSPWERLATSTETINNIGYQTVLLTLSPNSPITIPQGAVGCIMSLTYVSGATAVSVTQDDIILYQHNSSGGSSNFSLNIQPTVLFTPLADRTLFYSGGSFGQVVRWFYAR